MRSAGAAVSRPLTGLSSKSSPAYASVFPLKHARLLSSDGPTFTSPRTVAAVAAAAAAAASYRASVESATATSHGRSSAGVR